MPRLQSEDLDPVVSPRFLWECLTGASAIKCCYAVWSITWRSARTCAFYLFIRQPHGSEVSPAARNTLDSARIPRASKLLICGLFQKGRVLAQDGVQSLRQLVFVAAPPQYDLVPRLIEFFD